MTLVKDTNNKAQTVFTIIFGMALASIFFRHGIMNVVALIFVISLLIFRPKISWMPPLWWALAFSIWEWVSNFIGPYGGGSIEGLGIGYHFLFFLIPLTLYKISDKALFSGVFVGAFSSAILMWLQGIYGINLNDKPFRIAWVDNQQFGRTPGFNDRPWESQFIHSIVMLLVWSHFSLKNTKTWILLAGLFSGVVLPQIRAVFLGLIASFTSIVIFSSKNKSTLLKKLSLIVILAIVGIAIMSFLRPSFFKNLESGNGRDQIFKVSYQIFLEYPHTGLGGGEYFKKHFQEEWLELNMPKNGLFNIGHTHNDILMLLVHHGWPALLFWLGFIIHSLKFVWQYGDKKDRILFTSLVVFHHVAGLAESYLDYSNTTYALLLCYGVAMHGSYRNYNAIRSGHSVSD